MRHAYRFCAMPFKDAVVTKRSSKHFIVKFVRLACGVNVEWPLGLNHDMPFYHSSFFGVEDARPFHDLSFRVLSFPPTVTILRGS
ncbi:unnamed protein product [Dibothriocephalus latus]|uniref:Uncharacterized protein n=1 Tax=Dibothriocephalus latus TaxID=60516 RepID=A0A3P7PMN5_DIBLA|nr:unnamed protein product [Dibothriocephalus latus]